MLRFHYLSNNEETTVLGSDYPASLLFREGQFSAVWIFAVLSRLLQPLQFTYIIIFVWMLYHIPFLLGLLSPLHSICLIDLIIPCIDKLFSCVVSGLISC
jgi:hypothetical protein